ncbi:hypothetical protein AURDEDRAFT_169733 [Auricularia subglabra TFB-10046 SS5]|nr:hypothetical protein AURDEDRAFT_169733 [Auricularia subglabra TFB-10046 SS5]
MKRVKGSKGKAANPKPPKRPRRDENTPARPPAADKGPTAPQQPRASATTNNGNSRSTGDASTTTRRQNNTTGRSQQGRQEASGRSSPSSQVGDDDETAEPEDAGGGASEDEQEDEDTTPNLKMNNRETVEFLKWWTSLSAADAEAVRTVGRQACMYVPFDKFEQVFYYGALAEEKEKDPPAQPSAADKDATAKAAEFTFTLSERCAWEWKHFKESFPVVQDLLGRHSSKYLARKACAPAVDSMTARPESDFIFVACGLQLNHYRGQRRGGDTMRFKELALLRRKWEPAIELKDINDKTVRGLNHPQMAQLLLPPSEDWNDATTQHAYLLAANKKKLSPLVMPRLLYPEDDPHQKKGPSFCKNEFLPEMAQGLVLGSKSALKGDRVAAGNSITNKLGINFVTLPFIAYVCCQGRCAIANETAFGAAGECGFKYRVFYNQILKTLVGIEALGPVGEDAITELMTWWQERIWGKDAGEGEQDDAEASEELTNTPADILAAFARHVEEYDREQALRARNGP